MIARAQKIVLYGPGSVGKTKLCSLMEAAGVKPLIIDVEQGSHFLNVSRLDTVETWDDLRDALRNEKLLAGYDAVVIDSLTKAEEMAVAWTLANIPREKGQRALRTEDYGWGKGLTHVYETFLTLLGDLDAIVRGGKHVVLTCHECTANVPNPAGEDFIRYEPRLQSPSSGKSSIRHRTKEWCDHLFFIGFDAAVDEDGKAVGSGTRTIYTTELPMWWSKSRSLSEPVVYRDGDPAIWQQLFQK